jgi:general secretion pathway protein D
LLSKAAQWVRQLDLESDMLANVHVYHVENYKARNLADLLTQAYGGEVAVPAVREREALGAGRGVLPSLTPGQGLLSPRSLGEGMSTRGTSNPTSSTGVTAEGEGGTPTLTSPQAGGPLAGVFPKERATPARPGAEGTAPKEGIRIIPDEVNNLLIVVAPPHEWRVIHALLKKLDIMPRQVMCEVLFAEVRLTGELQYGVEWFINSQQRATLRTQPTFNLDVLPGASAAFSTVLGGFTFAARDKLNQFRGVINLLAQDGLVNILASPHIMSANNQEAMIHIGQDVPILTSTSTPLISQETSFSTQTVQYRSSGIILVVKPQINAKGLITLDIVQEVSTPVQTTTGVTSTPTFTIRTARTSLITADNQTIVLGGLMRDDKFRGSSGIPGVRKLPLLGPLFGSESSRSERTELIVLITPQLVSDLVDGAHITNTVRERLQPEVMDPLEKKGSQPPSPKTLRKY